MIKLSVMAVSVIFLVGCSQPIEPPVTPDETADHQQIPESQPTEESAEGKSDTEPVACRGELLTQMSGTIESQIQAFGERDFERAYSFASPFFRSTVTVDQFVQIINGSYGPLIGSSRLVFSECFSDSEETYGVIVAKFIEEDNDVYDLQYVMVNTEEGWRVQGASNLRFLGQGA